jgi:hypothetical protein
MIQLNKMQARQLFDPNFPELLHPEVFGRGPYTEQDIPGGPVDPFVKQIWKDIVAGLCSSPMWRSDLKTFIEYKDPEVEMLRILEFGKPL